MKEKEDAGELRVICAYCKKLLGSGELWKGEDAVQYGENTHGISHGICPDCLLFHFPKEYLAIQEERRIRIRKLFKKGFTDMYGHIAK